MKQSGSCKSHGLFFYRQHLTSRAHHYLLSIQELCQKVLLFPFCSSFTARFCQTLLAPSKIKLLSHHLSPLRHHFHPLRLLYPDFDGSLVVQLANHSFSQPTVLEKGTKRLHTFVCFAFRTLRFLLPVTSAQMCCRRDYQTSSSGWNGVFLLYRPSFQSWCPISSSPDSMDKGQYNCLSCGNVLSTWLYP